MDALLAAYRFGTRNQELIEQGRKAHNIEEGLENIRARFFV